jgi:tetratricopeptide (TPR) repeat protein
MKRFLMTLAAMSMAAGMAAAQAPSGAPANKTQTPAAGQAQPAASAPKLPQAKTQDEYTAFMDAINKTNPSDAEQAAREFEIKYPQSELLSILYQQVMTKYQQADNADKTAEMGRKAIHYDPDNTAALVLTGTVISEQTRETDIDKNQKLAEADKYLKRALETVEQNKLKLPPSATPQQVQAFKDQVTFMAYAGLGQIELIRKNDAAAEGYLRKALAVQQGSTDALTWLRLSLALDHQNKYADALNAANKAVDNSGNNAAVGNLAKVEQSRLRQLTAGNGGAAPAASAPLPTQPEPQTVQR